ncbi:MAG TPA: MFS transporter, partial [Longimicrobiales bacterium]|nr:MFS transporter [Longimicrobiales bacterium]
MAEDGEGRPPANGNGPAPGPEGSGDGPPEAGAVRYGSAAGHLALLPCILGSGMAFLDSTAVNVALPTLGRDLGTGFAGFQWVVNAFLLTLGSLVLLGGALGDRLGRRRVFLAGVVVFAGASLACALAPGTGTLVAFRTAQGVGAALLVPTSLALVQATFREEDRAEAIGAWSGFSGISTLVGPLLGGWLADAVSWRAVFLINLPLAALTALAALRYLPGSRDPERAGSLDLAGAAAAVVALGGVVF